MLAFPPPPSPSPPPPSPPLIDSPVTSVSGDGHSGGPSVLIIVGIIAFVIAASASIHLLLRLISRSRSSSSSSSSSPPSPTPLLRTLSIAGNGAEPPTATSDRDQLISSLPLFTLATSISALQKSQSLDCAVCLSNFRPHDELRLLPACRHAFHSQCVDTWLRSTPSCPLCRASIHLPAAVAPPAPPVSGSSRSGSFRVELGSVSRRRASEDGIPASHGRSYSLGSSFEYLVDEEVEAVLERLRRAPEGKPENGGVGGDPPPPGAEVSEAAGGGGRGWLRDCVDRLTSSASSSFNSLRFSGRIGSHRFDPATALPGGGGSGGRSWDFEASNFVEWEEESGFGMFYRWLVGV